MFKNKSKANLFLPILSFLVICGVWFGLSRSGVNPTRPEEFRVLRVVDGDTIVVETIGKVRYIGVNTPETHHPVKGVEYYGKEAYAANQRLVAGKKVRLEYDVQREDKYGRTLAYVYAGKTFVNAKLMEDGYAQVMTVPPNVKHAEDFLDLQRKARSAGKGLWGRAARTASRAIPVSPSKNTAVYWANTNSKKFHRPDCKWARRISPAHLLKSEDRGQLIEDGYQPCGICRP
jgi:micrococcal nuclease